MRRVGRKIVVDRLLVADVDEDRPEHGQFGDFRRRHEESALEHILHDARGFQADRLAARVGPRNDEDMLATVQLHVERHDLAALRPERLLQQGMAGVFQHQPVVGRDDRLHAAVLRGPAPFGAQHVDLGEVIARIGDQLRIGTHRIGELREDADNLAPLSVFQFAQFVVDLHHLDRLDVERASGSRLVVDEALQFALVGRGDRNHGFAFADRNLGVGIDDAGVLGGRQHGLQTFGGLSLAFADGAPDLQQTGRSVVLHVAETIDDGVDPLHDFGKGRDAAAAGVKRRILFFAVENERDDAADDRQRTMQRHHFLDVEE